MVISPEQVFNFKPAGKLGKKTLMDVYRSHQLIIEFHNGILIEYNLHHQESHCVVYKSKMAYIKSRHKRGLKYEFRQTPLCNRIKARWKRRVKSVAIQNV